MKKITYVLTFIFAIICINSTSGLAQTAELKFDNELAAEFAKGMSGDAASFDHAMQRAETILAANPKDAQTLVWMGSATLAKSGQVFATGNFMEGGRLWKTGRQKMDEAVLIDGANNKVLIVRGSTYLNASEKYPFKEEADKLRTLGTADLEKIIASTKGKTDEDSVALHTEAIQKFIRHYVNIDDKENAELYQKMLTAK